MLNITRYRNESVAVGDDTTVVVVGVAFPDFVVVHVHRTGHPIVRRTLAKEEPLELPTGGRMFAAAQKGTQAKLTFDVPANVAIRRTELPGAWRADGKAVG